MGRRHDRTVHRTRHHTRHHAGPGPVPGDPTVALALPRRRGTAAGLLLRSAVLGVAAGSRASLALAAPTLADPTNGGLKRLGARVGVLVELTGDKLPSTPSRLNPPGPQSRAVAAALGGVALARQRGRSVVLPAATAALFSAAGTWGGAAWRAWAAQRGPDYRGAFAEDAVALTLATLASYTRR